MKSNWTVIGVLAAALVLMVGAGLYHGRSGARAGLAAGGSVRGNAAPDFALVDIETGRTVHLSDYKGKAVLLNFWATWCPPCKVEIPWFVDLQKQYASQGLAVVGVAMDDAGGDKIKKFSESMGINYPVLQGTETVSDLYGGVEDLPTTFYIGRDGRVISRVLGLRSHADVEESVKLALSQGEATNTAQSVGSR